ncbi:hypothetical protein DOTSEDRAFT_72870 [Dothistroma septosporum NZE10]|uniref:NTF2-like domain-containing protein n=1 Tax=Dothistroma septosporum (strain NZE10 / CBS 128990) TaxID=675120 RepID=M2YPU8_DOTSN|nr:hypothetical protein DOTSEDRAFT_72870 [Dothistroma septosporum NZE10]
MRFVFLAIAGLAIVALANPAKRACMTDDDANRVANNFRTLITDYSNATAAQVLCTDFTDYSDSVSELINNGCPNGPQALGSATFSSLAAFQAGQGSQPNIPFEILNIWHNCDTVTMRWRSITPGTVQPEEQVVGIVVMETVYSGGEEPYLINTVYSEFNSGAWLYDLGVFVPSCNATAATVKRNLLFKPRRMI